MPAMYDDAHGVGRGMRFKVEMGIRLADDWLADDNSPMR